MKILLSLRRFKLSVVSKANKWYYICVATWITQLKLLQHGRAFAIYFLKNELSVQSFMTKFCPLISCKPLEDECSWHTILVFFRFGKAILYQKIFGIEICSIHTAYPYYCCYLRRLVLTYSFVCALHRIMFLVKHKQ